MTASCVHLWILSFSEQFFYRALPENCYFLYKLKNFNHQIHKKLFHRSFQAFYTRTRSSHSKTFIYLKPLKTVCEEVNLQWSCKIPTFKLTKKLFLTTSFMHFAFIFSEYSRLLFPKRLWKWASTISFRKYKRKVVLLVIYLFNYDSSKSTFLMLNMAFDVLFLTFWILRSCNNIITRTSFFLLCVLM